MDELNLNEKKKLNYEIWKKNTPFLYDYLNTTKLLWPSLTVQFFPDLTKIDNNGNPGELNSQRLLFGSFNLDKSINTLSIAKFQYLKNLNKNIDMNYLVYNEEIDEFELKYMFNTKLNVFQKINVNGDVNKAQYMPQNPNLIAISNNFGEIKIFERTKHTNFNNSFAKESVLNDIQIILLNKKINKSPIFTFDWNNYKEGFLLSGNNNGDINFYDIKKSYTKSKNHVDQISSINISSIINEIQWNSNHDSIFTTVDEIGFLNLYDIRVKDLLTTKYQISSIGINSVDFNPNFSMCIATGDVCGSIKVWDLRFLDRIEKKCLFEVNNQNTDSITQLKWNPKLNNVLCSSSLDCLVKIFDMKKQEEEGLVFTHNGHLFGVNDFDWSLHDHWMIVSVSDDNSLHIWRPSYHVTRECFMS